MPVTLNDALSDYYDTKLRHLARSTRDAHEGELERWRKWVVKETQVGVYLETIDDRMMVRYFNRYLPPGHSPSTYNAYRQYHKKFWDFCRGEAWVGTNPMRHVDPLRAPRRVRLLLSPDEMLRMLDQAEPRDRIALALGMHTALRAGDLARLTIGQVNLANLSIQVFVQKTGVEEILPVTAELEEELMRWFRTYGALTGMPWQDLPNTWTLIPPTQSVANNVHDLSKGRRLTLEPTRQLQHMERIVQAGLAKLGHPTKGEGFHTLRRSALRAVYDLAAATGDPTPIRTAQATAGHKNQQTTEIYLGITHEKQKRDDLLRGQSFLARASEIQRAQRQQSEDGGSVALRGVV